MENIAIGLEFNGTDGSVGEVEGTSETKIRAILREFPGSYFLIWINGARTDTPLRSWGAIQKVLAREVLATL